MRFTKMHGLGNDYVYVDCFREQVDNPAELAAIISDRHRGVGGDGLILIGPSDAADVRMRIFNADGSEAEMCGNGIRCVAKYAYEHNLARAGGPVALPGHVPLSASLSIETANGTLKVGLITDTNNKVQRVCVNMSAPVLNPEQVPVRLTGERIVDQPIDILGRQLLMTCVSMGNPHAIFFCDNVETVALEQVGPVIENHPLFPKRTNVHFVQVLNPRHFRMRTWERGSGITLACGTGACACCVAAVLKGLCGRICIASLPGGELELNWSEDDNCVYMTGPAVEVFEGVWPD
jgi:diaminopimelate epimerase